MATATPPSDRWRTGRHVEEISCVSPLNRDRHNPLDKGTSSSQLRDNESLQRCYSIMAMIDGLLGRPHVLAEGELPSYLREHRREKMLPPCRLMALPAELREQIFAFAVTEWVATPDEFAQIGVPPRTVRVLQQRPIRIDRLNKPAPPAITLVSRQARAETLQLYYQLNAFECWRPFRSWNSDWSSSTFIDWLSSLGKKTTWLRHIVLLYKHSDELSAYDVESALAEEGFNVSAEIFNQLGLSEYEMSYEAMGLPRHFGRPRRRRHR